MSPRLTSKMQSRGGQASAPGFRDRVLALVARIPSSYVATYGQISQLAGYPRRARHVGNVLAGLPPGHDLPWHRVINAQGRISPRGGGARLSGFSHRNGGRASLPRRGAVTRQEKLLRREGVHFKNGQVDLARYRWEPVIDEAWAKMLTDA